MTYWSNTSLISCGVGTCVMASATSRSSSSARISLHRAMHSLQMYTEGPEMNFRTESFDFPQNEQRRCLSWDIQHQGTMPGSPAEPLRRKAGQAHRRIQAEQAT